MKRKPAGQHGADGEAKGPRHLGQLHRESVPAAASKPERPQAPLNTLAEEEVAAIAEEVDETGGDGAVRRREEVVHQHIRQVGDVDGADSPPEGAVSEGPARPVEGKTDDLQSRPYFFGLPQPLVCFLRSACLEDQNKFTADSQMPGIFWRKPRRHSHSCWKFPPPAVVLFAQILGELFEFFRARPGNQRSFFSSLLMELS